MARVAPLGRWITGAALGALLAACQSPPTPAVPTPSATVSPQPQPALAASPSVAPSPHAAAPSPVAAPAPTVAPGSPFPLDSYPFAVMIDNIKAARPQFGVNEADVVYEAPAEGGIPRLMPIYLRAGAQVNSIGPVRSARHYFVDVANEYRTPLVHIGASPQGYDALAATGLEDLDEERGDGGFVRDHTRLAPHNAFVSTTSVRDQLRQRSGPIHASLGPLVFGAFTAGAEPATTVDIAYPGGEHYQLEYDYDGADQVYNRSMDGIPDLDGATGDQTTATSIIIQYADVEPIPGDDAGRLDITLIGSGKGLLIADGTQAPLRWSRTSLSAPTHFSRTDGAPFALPDGQVWVQIVPLETQISIS